MRKFNVQYYENKIWHGEVYSTTLELIGHETINEINQKLIYACENIAMQINKDLSDYREEALIINGTPSILEDVDYAQILKKVFIDGFIDNKYHEDLSYNDFIAEMEDEIFIKKMKYFSDRRQFFNNSNLNLMEMISYANGVRT